MTNVNLSLFAGAGAQFLDNSGNVLTGGLVYSYAAGTTTPLAAYISSAGSTAHSNPIILDASGRVPGGEIWLASTSVYKFVLKDANNVLIGTYDNINIAPTDITYTGALTGGTASFTQLTVGGTKLGAGDSSSLKNRIINGAMMIDQRNAGASVTPINAQYILDRFFAGLTQASKFTVQQNAGSVTPPVGYTKYLGVTSSSAYSVIASDYFSIEQKIEGFNIADLAWGTVNAKPVTLSFQVYSSLTGNFGGAIRNAGGGYTYPFSYTISSANTWTSISITITGPTSGTWLTDNSTGMYVTLGLGVGSTYSGTAGAWSTSNLLSVIGATSVVGTSGATFYITGVQLETGTNASGFEFRQYGTELTLCQRYFQNVTLASVYSYFGCFGATAALSCTYSYKVQMRTIPTVTSPTWSLSNCGTPAVQSNTQDSITWSSTASAIGNAIFSNTSSIPTSAEL